MTKSAIKLCVLGLTAMGMTACSSERVDRPVLNVAQAFVKRAPAPVISDPQQVAADIAAALPVIDGPLALATFEKTQNNVVLREIETNGPYSTWSSVSSAERRTISTLNGMLTSTRGLTQDLMSSDVRETLALVSARSSGSATRVQRYLDSENQIFEIRAQCTVSRGASTRVQIGEINRMAIEMAETCQAGTRSFKNVYRVDGSGRILQSVQWMNDFYGATVVQQLR